MLFGVTSSDILMAKSPLVVLAPLFQESPTVVYGLKGTRLNSPADLRSLNLGMFIRNGNGYAEIKTMLVEAGLDPVKNFPQVTKIRRGLKDLVDGLTDVAIGYTIDLGWFEEGLGLKTIHLRPSSYGVDFYGDSLFTRLVPQMSAISTRFGFNAQSTGRNTKNRCTLCPASPRCDA